MNDAEMHAVVSNSPHPVPTIIGSTLQQKSALLQNPEVSNADEVVVNPWHLTVSRKPCGTWKTRPKCVLDVKFVRSAEDVKKQTVLGLTTLYNAKLLKGFGEFLKRTPAFTNDIQTGFHTVKESFLLIWVQCFQPLLHYSNKICVHNKCGCSAHF